MFSTRDFNTMVLLRYHGISFDEVVYEGHDGKTKRVFVQETPQLKKILLDYDNNKLEVKAREWMRTIDDVKEFVHR